MFPPAPEIHPSRQVERIREILVGRQMESVERRLEKLEGRLAPLPAQPEDDVFRIRLDRFEERHDREIRELRDEIDASRARQVEETHRLAGQIQAVARSRAELGIEAQAELERKIGRWLEQWQAGFARQVQQREEFLIRELRAEIERQRDWMKCRLTERADTRRNALQAGFARLAAAAREIADAAEKAGNASTEP